MTYVNGSPVQGRRLQFIYAVLFVGAVVLLDSTVDIVRGIPDDYPHQHLGLILTPLGCITILSIQLTKRQGLRFTLLAAGGLLVAASVGLTVSTLL